MGQNIYRIDDKIEDQPFVYIDFKDKGRKAVFTEEEKKDIGEATISKIVKILLDRE